MDSAASTQFCKIKVLSENETWHTENFQNKQHTGQKRNHNGNLKVCTLNDNKNRTYQNM